MSKSFGLEARKAIIYGLEIAKVNHLDEVGPEEFMRAILTFDCDGRRALQSEGIDLQKLDECLQQEAVSTFDLQRIDISLFGRESFDIALSERVRAKSLQVTTLMLALGCLQSRAPRIKEAVERLHISHHALRKHLRRSESIEPSEPLLTFLKGTIFPPLK